MSCLIQITHILTLQGVIIIRGMFFLIQYYHSEPLPEPLLAVYFGNLISAAPKCEPKTVQEPETYHHRSLAKKETVELCLYTTAN